MSEPRNEPTRVVITDIDIPFRSIAWLIVKFLLAVLWIAAMIGALVLVGVLLRSITG